MNGNSFNAADNAFQAWLRENWPGLIAKLDDVGWDASKLHWQDAEHIEQLAGAWQGALEHMRCVIQAQIRGELEMLEECDGDVTLDGDRDVAAMEECVKHIEREQHTDDLWWSRR